MTVCACAWMHADASTNTRAFGKKDRPKLIAQSFCSSSMLFLSGAEKRRRETLALTDIKSSSTIADALDLRTKVASY